MSFRAWTAKELDMGLDIRFHRTAVETARYWNAVFEAERTMKEIEQSKERHPSNMKRN